MIDPKRACLPIIRQCTLLQLNRSGVYYRPVPQSEANLELMRLIDAQFLETPYYGSRQMTWHLRRQGHDTNRCLLKPMSITRTYWFSTLAGTPISPYEFEQSTVGMKWAASGSGGSWRSWACGRSTRSRARPCPIRSIGNIHICYGIWSSIGLTRSGVPISHIFP